MQNAERTDEHTGIRLHVVALTHVGRRRYVNEDCIAIDGQVLNASMDAPRVRTHALIEPCVCLVADGMGGHPAGDVASRTVLERLNAVLPAAQAEDRALVDALVDANRLLFEIMAQDATVTGMGTTLAGISVTRAGVAIFNVGDSRVYRVRQGEIEQLSVDDSEPASVSFFSWQLPSRVLNQCLGGYPGADEIEPHLLREPAVPGCTYLICSDGLHDMLSDQVIAACIDDDPARSVAALFANAMEEGGNDNISIILARIEAGASDPQPVS